MPGCSSIDAPAVVVAGVVKLINRLSLADGGLAMNSARRALFAAKSVCAVPPAVMAPLRSTHVPLVRRI